MSTEAFTVPLEVEVTEGEVVLTGPDGICASFTVEAAKVSVRRLLDAIRQIEGDDGEVYQKPPG